MIRLYWDIEILHNAKIVTNYIIQRKPQIHNISFVQCDAWVNQIPEDVGLLFLEN